MKFNLARVFKTMATATASFAINSTALAENVWWTGEDTEDSTSVSAAANWMTEASGAKVPTEDDMAQFTGGAADKTITFDQLLKVNYAWTNPGTKTSVVTWEATEDGYGIDSAGNIAFADGDGQSGTLRITNGTYKTAAIFRAGFGAPAYAVFEMLGGSLETSGYVTESLYNGADVDALSYSFGAEIGSGLGATTDMTLSNATFSVTGGDVVLDLWGAWQADYDSSTTNPDSLSVGYVNVDINNDAVFSCGSEDDPHLIMLGAFGVEPVTVNVNDGGTLRAAKIMRHFASGTSSLNINGGTLEVLGQYDGETTFISDSGFSVVIGANGCTIDTGDADEVVIAPVVSGTGGLTKKGSGTLTFTVAPTFTGSVTVEEGSVVVPDDAALTTGDNTISTYDSSTSTYTYSAIPSDAYVWTNEAGDDDWTNAENWSVNGSTASEAPTNGVAVVIPAGYTVTNLMSSAESITFASLHVDGDLTILHSSEDSRLLAGSEGLTIHGSGTVQITDWNWRQIYIGTIVTLDPSLTLRIEVEDVKELNQGKEVLAVHTGSAITLDQCAILGSERTVEFDISVTDYISIIAGPRSTYWFDNLNSDGSVYWNDPQTISGDTDVLTDGSLLYAYSMHYQNSYTVNGVKFTRYYTPSDSKTLTFNLPIDKGKRASGDEVSAGLTVVDGVLSSDYKANLSGYYGAGAWSSGTPKDSTMTLGGLTIGKAYLLQIWCQASDWSGNSMWINGEKRIYSSIGGVGQYITGYFIATETNKVFSLTPYEYNSSHMPLVSALQVRELSEKLYWEGGETGTWEDSAVNWGKSSEYTIWHDPAGSAFDAAITNAATVTVSGKRLASELELSGGATLKVEGTSSNALTIGGDITATGDAKIVWSGNAGLSVGGAIVTDMDDLDATLTMDANYSAVTINRGTVSQEKEGLSADLTLPGQVYGDTTVVDKTSGMNAFYSGAGDVVVNSLTGHSTANGYVVAGGNITAEQKLTLDLDDDSFLAGTLIGTNVVKSGSGDFKFMGAISTKTLNISEGSFTLITPYQHPGVLYDLDATQTDTIETSNGVVTKWSDALGSDYYVTPKTTDDYVDFTGVAPTYESEALGGMPALVSDNFCMIDTTTQYQSSLFTIMKMVGESSSENTLPTDGRILVDLSDANDSSTHYRCRIALESGVAKYWEIGGTLDSTSSGYIGFNGEFGNTIYQDVPYLMTVPWHWTRTGNNSNNGYRKIAYGWGNAMAFGEILSLSTPLSLEEKYWIEDYLMKKWGLRTDSGSQPFGKAAVIVASGATFDANGIAATVKSMDVAGTLKGVDNLIVTGDVRFRAGAEIYVDSLSDVAMKVSGTITGGRNVIPYEKQSDGTYVRHPELIAKVVSDDDGGHLEFVSRGFIINVR